MEPDPNQPESTTTNEGTPAILRLRRRRLIPRSAVPLPPTPPRPTQNTENNTSEPATEQETALARLNANAVRMRLGLHLRQPNGSTTDTTPTNSTSTSTGGANETTTTTSESNTANEPAAATAEGTALPSVPVPTRRIGTSAARYRLQISAVQQLPNFGNNGTNSNGSTTTTSGARLTAGRRILRLGNSADSNHAAGVTPRMVANNSNRAGVPIGDTTTNEQQQGPFVPYAVSVSPLTGQALADARQELVDEQVYRDHDKDLDNCKCPICFEFLKDPAGCGQCTTRFCFDCLSKVLRTNNGTQRRQSTAVCPVCRNDLRAIQRDEAFQRELEQVDSIPCRYQDCSELLSLTQVAEHEAVCSHVRVACAYAEYGCEWTGTRSDCPEHETEDCAYGNVSSLVQEVRTVRADYGHRFRYVNNRLRAVDGLVNAHVQLVRGNNKQTSPSNPLDLLGFVVAITCATPHFLWTKSRWTALHATPEGRAIVFNTLALFPSLLMAGKFVISGYSKLTTALSLSVALSSAAKDDIIDLTLVTLIIGLLGLLAVVCVHVDSRSAIRWQILSNPILGQGRAIKSATTISLIALHAFVFDWTGGTPASAALWLWVTLSSVCFPTAVVAASVRANAHPPLLEIQLFSQGRVALPVSIGLRYGFAVALLGIFPCADAIAFLHLVQNRLGLRLISSENLNASYCSFFVGGRIAIKAAEWLKTGPTGWDSVVATLLLLAMRLLIPRLAIIGAMIGDSLIDTAKTQLLPDGRGTKKDCSGIGVGVFGAWIFLSVLILATN